MDLQVIEDPPTPLRVRAPDNIYIYSDERVKQPFRLLSVTEEGLQGEMLEWEDLFVEPFASHYFNIFKITGATPAVLPRRDRIKLQRAIEFNLDDVITVHGLAHTT